jgi:hypothetical protein
VCRNPHETLGLARQILSLFSKYEYNTDASIFVIGYVTLADPSDCAVRGGCADAHLLVLWVRIPPGEWMFYLWILCAAQVEVSATGRSLVQRSSTKWCVCVTECEQV